MIKKFRLLLLQLILTTSSFGQIDIYDSINVDGVWRTFNTHLPPGYNIESDYPLVLGFHGGQQVATSSQGWSVFAYQSELSEKADLSGFIAVYPEGRVINQNRTWNAGNCCAPAMNQNVDDVGFINHLLDTLLSHYSIDASRVYATGSSNGGMLCYRLACELSHRFAAIAPNACSQMHYPCHPANTIPLISFHSKVDPYVSYIGGLGEVPPLTNIFFPSQDSTLKVWSQNNHCMSRDTIANGNGTSYDFIRIHNCSCNVELHHYATSDGSHSWPGGNPNNNPVSNQINATDLLWSFFQNYTSNCQITDIDHGIEANQTITVFPNPFTTRIHVINIAQNENFTLLNCLGTSVWTGNKIEQNDFSELPNGLYFLKMESHSFKLLKE